MVPPPPYSDYIPASDADFDTWAASFSPQYAGSGLLLPDPIVVATEIVAFGAALTLSTSGATRGPSSIAAKDVQRAITESLCRLGAQAMIQSFLNGVLTAQDLTDAGVRIPSTVATPRLPPAMGPDLVLRGCTPGILSFAVTQPGAAGFKKAPGVVGAEIWAGPFEGDPLIPPAQVHYQILATRKVIAVPSGAWFSQQVRVQARWVTVRGATSPFGVPSDVVAS